MRRWAVAFCASCTLGACSEAEPVPPQSADERFAVRTFEQRDSDARDVRVTSLASSADGQELCGFAVIRQARVTTFYIRRAPGGEVEEFLFQPTIDRAPDREAARQAVGENALKISQRCAKANLLMGLSP